ncbi:MAG: hypothetical protein WKF56_02935 [Candidatus Limnocylindrales bacterium]
MNIFGRRNQPQPEPTKSADERALERYRYMLATAAPEDIERAHEESFARLTQEQRQQALQALAGHVPAGELRGDDAASLARAATRAEVRQPGTLERAWGPGGGGGAGGGFGLGSWFMSTLAASFIGTAIAQSFFDNDPGSSAEGDGSDASDGGDTGSDTGMADGDSAGGDGGGDFGGGDGGGDFGGGDFGGGDFGGGDFGGF